MAISLAEALKDFGRPERAPPAADMFPAFDLPAPDFELPGELAAEPAPGSLEMPEPEPEPGPDIGAIVAEAVAAAEAALAERMTAEAQAAAKAAERRHGVALAGLQASLGEALGEKLAAGLADTEARLVELVTSATARILAPVLGADLQQRAVDALAATVREALRDSEALRVRVRGPQSMLAALEKAMGDQAARLEMSEAAGADLVVALDDSLFETRLGEWSVAASGVLE